MNIAFWRNLAVTVVLAAAAAYAGARLGQMNLGQMNLGQVNLGQVNSGTTRAGPAEAPRSRLLLRDSVYQMVHQDLTLTADQGRRIDAIEARYAHRRNELRTKIGSANAELGEALANEMALGTAASRALEHLQQNMGDLQRTTILYVLEVRAVLTPRQQQALDQKVFESLTAGPF